jgi:hypothetical protein
LHTAARKSTGYLVIRSEYANGQSCPKMARYSEELSWRFAGSYLSKAIYEGHADIFVVGGGITAQMALDVFTGAKERRYVVELSGLIKAPYSFTGVEGIIPGDYPVPSDSFDGHKGNVSVIDSRNLYEVQYLSV